MNTKTLKALALYLASLQSSTIILQICHWKSVGKSSYSNHLMFERAYGISQDTLDKAAEKFVGIFGSECLDLSLQNDLRAKVLTRYESYDNPENLSKMAILIEKDIIKYSQDLYNLLEKENLLTLGLDDFIMSTSSRHEEIVYFIQQSLD